MEPLQWQDFPFWSPCILFGETALLAWTCLSTKHEVSSSMSQSSRSSSSSLSLQKPTRVPPTSRATRSKEPLVLHAEDKPSQDVLNRMQVIGRYESALLYGYLEHKKHFYTPPAFKIGLVRDWRFALVSSVSVMTLSLARSKSLSRQSGSHV